MRDLRRSVLLGDPGAGKTTTLLKLTVELARAAQADPAAKLPVFVPLRQFNGETDFATFVQRQTYTLQDLYPTLSASGRLFLLCDALNEMPRRGRDDGRDLVAEVRDYLRGQPDWVVSCRVRDYTDDLNGIDGIGKIRLKPLDPPRIHDFIQRKYEGWGQAAVGAALWRDLRGSDLLLSFWQKVSEKGEGERFWDASAGVPSHTSGDEDSAWQALHADHRRLLALCRSPFLANMICVLYRELHRRGEALPDNRAGLYAGFVGNLLRAEARRCEQVGLTWLGDAPIRAGMGQIAWTLGAQTEMERGAAEALLRAHVPAHDPAAVLSAAAAAGIIDYGTDVRFTHQLLQQYFAAAVLGRQMDTGSDPADIWQPGNWWLSTGREETAILLAGDRNDPQGVARWLAPAQPEFALELLTQPDFALDSAALLSAAAAAGVIDSARAKTGEPHPVGRATAYRVLGHLNADTRPGVGLRPDGVPDIAWAQAVRPGSYRLGGDEKAYGSLPAQTVELDYPFWLAKYPVTYAQYAAFVHSDGYTNPDYWTEAGWKRKGAKTHPEAYWNDPDWHIANHPVIGVTWYEAVAFTRWLDALYHKHHLWDNLVGTTQASSGGLMDPTASATLNDPTAFEERTRQASSLQIRLPTEIEWEMAARGQAGLFYPYGNSFDAAKGNTEETGIGRTSAVGIFPGGASPCGALDMSGNVWEWCLNKHKSVEDVDIDGTGVRVLRGGSWGYLDTLVRAADRNWYNPVDSDYFNGFRCALS
jgi:formylglycine-generating enzyme required for sulfatase activity